MFPNYEMELSLQPDFSDVLIVPGISDIESRSEVSLTSKMKDGWNPIPIMSANMDTVTGPEMAFELLKRGWIAVLHKYVSIPDISNLYNQIEEYNKKESNKLKIDTRNLFISRGTTEEDQFKLKERLLGEPRIKSVCIDVANGQRKTVISYAKQLKETDCSDKILMVGNIVTAEAALLYAEAGVDIIKVGIGPGSACTTRIQTGVGFPQIGAVIEIKQALAEKSFKTQDESLKEKYTHLKICLDGGMKITGDIAKAFVAGADFVMLGGMLAAHKESPGKLETINDPHSVNGERKVKRFSGMAAKESQLEGVPEYGTEEGKSVNLPYRGKIVNTLKKIEGGLRSAGTYINATNISQFKQARLVRTHVQENRVFNQF